MPRKGVFTRVLRSGSIRVGDEIELIPPAPDRPFTAAVITLSDKGAAGQREDKSGPLMEKMLREAGYDVVEALLLSDEPAPLRQQLIRLADQRQVNLILTSGGTGFSLRDQTPEATLAVADRQAPGIAEYIRMCSARVTDRAMLSRGVSVIRKGSLIINLPGSPKACMESMDVFMDAIPHAMGLLRGEVQDCAR
jgi:molybdenum cofactor synthesis domain-containing protein